MPQVIERNGDFCVSTPRTGGQNDTNWILMGSVPFVYISIMSMYLRFEINYLPVRGRMPGGFHPHHRERGRPDTCQVAREQSRALNTKYSGR